MVLITSTISNALKKKLEDIHAELHHTNCLYVSQYCIINLEIVIFM